MHMIWKRWKYFPQICHFLYTRVVSSYYSTLTGYTNFNTYILVLGTNAKFEMQNIRQQLTFRNFYLIYIKITLFLFNFLKYEILGNLIFKNWNAEGSWIVSSKYDRKSNKTCNYSSYFIRSSLFTIQTWGFLD